MSETDPLVTIVTPAFDAAAHIRETARSVFAQSRTDWEWIVADDGSTDGTPDLVRALGDSRVTVIPGEHSGLPAVGRNRALARARGRYIAFLDADDVWMPGKLARQVEYLESTPSAGLVFTRVLHYFDDNKRLSERADHALRSGPNPGALFTRLCLGHSIVPSSVLMRRTLIDRFGAFDEGPALRGTEDFELFLRLAPHALFGWIDEPLVQYRLSPGALSANVSALARGRVLAMEKTLRANPGLSVPPRLAGRRLEALKLHILGVGELRACRDDCGRRTLVESIRLDPLNAASWGWWMVSLLGPRSIAALRRIYRYIM